MTQVNRCNIDAQSATRVVLPFDGRPLHEIEASDLARIKSLVGRLNGFLINGIAAAFLSCHSHPTSLYTEPARKCAILSTYDLPRVRFRGSDAELWRSVEPTRYWEKPLWLIPIHRQNEEHWVLVVASVHEQTLWFFDSFGEHRGWRPDLQVGFCLSHDTYIESFFLQAVMLLITRMVVLANRNQHSLSLCTEDPEQPWIARPLVPLVCAFRQFWLVLGGLRLVACTNFRCLLIIVFSLGRTSADQQLRLRSLGPLHDHRSSSWVCKHRGVRTANGSSAQCI